MESGRTVLPDLDSEAPSAFAEGIQVRGGVTMTLPRRTFLHLTAGAAALPIVSRIARGQAYPARPVRIIAGYSAGGIVDVLARMIGQSLSERLGQQFFVEKRMAWCRCAKKYAERKELPQPPPRQSRE